MNNGILLSEYIEEKDAINSPRPVYVDELKMLGIDEQIVLPTENVPVCWEIDHKYYYCGSVIAETSGGNIYQTPTVKIMDDAVGKFLMPIDIELLWKRNENALSTLENEAMDFINEQYEKYQDKPISGYVVAFSGGKDSQVILDLVSRVASSLASESLSSPRKPFSIFSSKRFKIFSTIFLPTYYKIVDICFVNVITSSIVLFFPREILIVPNA